MDEDDASAAGESLLDEFEDAVKATWNLIPFQIALSDPADAFTLGDGEEPEDGPTVSGGGLLTGALSTAGQDVKDGFTDVTGISTGGLPLWGYFVLALLIVLVAAYITREVAG